MLHGDISNKTSFIIGFRCEDFLIKYHRDGFSNKLKNFLFGESSTLEVNKTVLSAMKYVFSHTDYSQVLICSKKSYTSELQKFIEDEEIPILKDNSYLIDSESDISLMLMNGNLSYYIDDDITRRELVNNPYAVSMEEFNNVLRRRINNNDFR